MSDPASLAAPGFAGATLAGHGVPVLAAILIWFVATGIVAWISNRRPSTFAASLIAASLIGLAGLGLIVLSMVETTPAAAYAGCAGALMVWTWHEIAFLTGAAAGPRRASCPPGVRGWARFRLASATMMHHEAALAATALILAALCWDAPNTAGAQVFVLMFGLRLSSKLNLFAGVPNMALEILPPHLAYLKSYFGPRRLGPWLPASLVVMAALAGWLAWRALALPAGTGEAVTASLLFALAVLGILEHLFLALALPDGALWRWALPRPTASAAIAEAPSMARAATRRKAISRGEGDHGF